MAGLRWESKMQEDPRVVRAGPWGGLVYRAVVELARNNGRHGVVVGVFGSALAQHLGWKPEETIGDLPAARILSGGLEACVREKLLEREVFNDGLPIEGAYSIPDWPSFLLDPTAAARQQSRRDRRKKRHGDTGAARHRDRHGDSPPRHGDARKPRKGRRLRRHGDIPRADAPPRHGDIGSDRTVSTTESTTEARVKGRAAAPPAEPAPPGPAPFPAAGYLSASALAELQASGVRLHGRAGVSLAIWTGAIESLLGSGATFQEVVAAMKASRPCDPPHIALQGLRARYGTPAVRAPRRPAGAAPAPPLEPYGGGKRVSADEGPKEDL